MSVASRKFLIGVVLVMAIGGVIGWLYGQVAWGLLVAALAVLLLLIRNLLSFERALQSNDFDAIRYGEGIWQQIYARFKHERERANKYRKQYRQIIKEIQKSTNAMPDGAIVVDAQNEILTCNRATKGLIGLKRRKDRGQRLDNMFRDPGMAKLLQDNDSSQTADLASPLRENEWLNCRVVPYGPNQKLVLIRDVTGRITINKIRRDFVANASHELRSPLTVISGYLETLTEDEDLPADLVSPLSQMQVQARRMNAIVRDLLELSRLEGDGKADSDYPVEVGSLINTAKEALATKAGAPEIVVSIESDDRILGAEGEIDSIIYNLLSNAIRHTPADGLVEVTWRTNSKGGHLSVRDNGEGISADNIPRLTERFFRVDRGRARDEGGFGIGLAIVKHAVERHDGQLHISSELGEGSEFRCSFPVSRLSKPIAA